MQLRVALQDYRFVEFSIRWNENVHSRGQDLPSVVIMTGKSSDEPHPPYTRIQVKYQPQLSPQCEIKIDIIGILEVKEKAPNTSDAEESWLLALNGATILYGIARSEIASMTSNFPCGRIILPAIYMHDILTKQSEEAEPDSKNSTT